MHGLHASWGSCCHPLHSLLLLCVVLSLADLIYLAAAIVYHSLCLHRRVVLLGQALHCCNLAQVLLFLKTEQ